MNIFKRYKKNPNLICSEITESTFDSYTNQIPNFNSIIKSKQEELNKIKENKNKEIKTNSQGIRNTPPDFDEISAYFKSQGFTDTSHEFYKYYSDRNWMIEDKPIRSWKRLAHSWNQNQFVDLPPEFNDVKTARIAYSKLPNYILDRVDSDQERSGCSMVTVNTLNLILNFLKKS